MESDYKPVATLKQIEEFVKYSPIWKDMMQEMKIWLSEIHMMLENLDGGLTHRELDRLGGSAEALRNLSNFPDVLIANAKTGKRKKKING